MSSNSNYETLYGVHLLDDLHNFFPALLYDSSSFRTVQDVLGYIQRQTRNRFDLFSYGLREYVSIHSPAPAPASVASYRQVVQTSSSVAPPTSTLNSTFAGVPATNVQVDVQTILHQDEEDDEEPPADNLTRALLGLLTASAGIRRNTVLPNMNNGRMTLDELVFGPTQMNQFLQPVVVRPTPEQIAANTTVGNLVSDTEHSCAICQDLLTEEQEGRKLNACGHWFHKTCIDTWLQGNVHCPVCRHDIREPMRQSIPVDEQN